MSTSVTNRKRALQLIERGAAPREQPDRLDIVVVRRGEQAVIRIRPSIERHRWETRTEARRRRVGALDYRTDQDGCPPRMPPERDSTSC